MTEATFSDSSSEIIEREFEIVRDLTGHRESEIAFIDSGWTSRVYVCDGGRWVVKFPRAQRVKREYARERQVLGLLEGLDTPVEVPRLRWIDDDDSYLGYDGIVGSELASHDYDIGPADKTAIGRSLGCFLRALHGLTPGEVRTISVADEVAEFRQKYEMSESVITDSFTAVERARLDHLVNDELPQQLLDLGTEPALCHGDLGYWNMILRKDGGIGIIDFGDAGYYDRSKDFMAIQDDEVLAAALDAYGDSDLLCAKIAARQKVLYLLDLPFFIGKHDTLGIQRTVAKIRSTL